MGSQLKATCTCGYNKIVLIGGGKLNYKTIDYFPCFCINCGEVILGNLKDKKLVCPNCSKSKVLSYNNEKLIGALGENIVERSDNRIITDGFYKCPKCKNMTLQFFSTGLLWD